MIRSPASPARPLVPPDIHAEGFQQVRRAHRQELAEDYVELIDDLIQDCGEARQVDIAARLGVAQPTVARMLKRLDAQGLVASRRYRGIALTAEGQSLANFSRRRHLLCESVLLALGVGQDAARRDAEGIEHHVSEETLKAFSRFLARCQREKK